MAIFNAYEVFEIAEQIERNGHDFYCRAAELASDRGTRNFLENMAKLEERHEDYFGRLKEKFALEKDAEFPDLDDQTRSYLRAMAAGNVFVASNIRKDLIKGDESLMDLIRIALHFEKDSVVYFSTVKELVKDAADRVNIDALIREELRHVSMLTEEMERLKELSASN
jgi:rubrerythrin